MFIHQGNLRGGNAGILEFEGGALFATEDNNVRSFDTNGTCSCIEPISILLFGVLFPVGKVSKKLQARCGGW